MATTSSTGGTGAWAGFVTVGILLFCTGIALELAVKNIIDPIYRTITCIAIVGILLLIWVELAVDAVSRTIGWLLG